MFAETAGFAAVAVSFALAAGVVRPNNVRGAGQPDAPKAPSRANPLAPRLVRALPDDPDPERTYDTTTTHVQVPPIEPLAPVIAAHPEDVTTFPVVEIVAADVADEEPERDSPLTDLIDTHAADDVEEAEEISDTRVQHDAADLHADHLSTAQSDADSELEVPADVPMRMFGDTPEPNDALLMHHDSGEHPLPGDRPDDERATSAHDVVTNEPPESAERFGDDPDNITWLAPIKNTPPDDASKAPAADAMMSIPTLAWLEHFHQRLSFDDSVFAELTTNANARASLIRKAVLSDDPDYLSVVAQAYTEDQEMRPAIAGALETFRPVNARAVYVALLDGGPVEDAYLAIDRLFAAGDADALADVIRAEEEAVTPYAIAQLAQSSIDLLAYCKRHAIDAAVFADAGQRGAA
jgi:hypothetical protein